MTNDFPEDAGPWTMTRLKLIALSTILNKVFNCFSLPIKVILTEFGLLNCFCKAVQDLAFPLRLQNCSTVKHFE